MTRKEIRCRLEKYFVNVPSRISFGRLKGRTLVDIEYEDFRSEPRVKAELRRMIGEDVHLNVKRNCSDTLMRQICRLLHGDPQDLKFHLMETLELP